MGPDESKKVLMFGSSTEVLEKIHYLAAEENQLPDIGGPPPVPQQWKSKKTEGHDPLERVGQKNPLAQLEKEVLELEEIKARIKFYLDDLKSLVPTRGLGEE